MILGKRLKQLRINAKLKQAEIGEILGVSQRTISNWENDIAQPSFELTKNLTSIYNIPIDYLYANDQATLNFINEKRNEIAERIKENKTDFLTYTAKNLALKINDIRKSEETMENTAEMLKLNFEINELITEHYEEEISKIPPVKNEEFNIIMKRLAEQIVNDKLLNSLL